MDPRGNNRPQNIEKETQLLYNLWLVLDLEKNPKILPKTGPYTLNTQTNTTLCFASRSIFMSSIW